MDRALATVADLPAVVAHGDFQPKNLVLSPGGIAALDWERASPAVPGLDLLFLVYTCYRLQSGLRPCGCSPGGTT